MELKIKWKALITSFIVVYSLGFIGSLFTGQSSNSVWYDLVKPEITPPGYVFPIVWNIIFFLIGLSLYLSWINSKKVDKEKVIFYFGINFILNVLWSLFYFGIRSPFVAFIDILLLEISIIYLLIFTSKIDKKAFYLLIPYLLWVSFAIILNYLSL